MKRILFPILFISLFSVLPLTTIAIEKSALISEIERAKTEREALLNEQRKLEAELRAINAEGATLGGAIKSLDATKRKLEKDIKITESRISSASLDIKFLEGEMTKSERQIVVHKGALNTLLQKLSLYDDRPLLLDVLASKDISLIWRDKDTLSSLNTHLGEEIDSLRETKKTLLENKLAKEKLRKQQENLQGQLSGQKVVVEESKSTKEQLLEETKSREEAYQKLLAENLERQRESEEDLFELESKLNIDLDANLVPKPRNGLIFWPLDYVYVTQRFGKTADSGRLYASGTHSGVDFRASVGTPVKAVLSGVVKGEGNTDANNALYRKQRKKLCYSFGGWVLIEHGNGLSSVYAHLSSRIVRPGQTVERGDIIGYSGGMPGQDGSGHSTGPHLHLGLFATQGIEIRKFSTSRGGCQDISLPIADVKAHLDPLAYLPNLE